MSVVEEFADIKPPRGRRGVCQSCGKHTAEDDRVGIQIRAYAPADSVQKPLSSLCGTFCAGCGRTLMETLYGKLEEART